MSRPTQIRAGRGQTPYPIGCGAHDAPVVEEDVSRRVQDREVSPGIVINPNRCGGQPTIKGTRVTARMLADLQAGDGGMRPEEIVDSYPMLSIADCLHAKGWDRKGRPGPNSMGIEKNRDHGGPR